MNVRSVERQQLVEFLPEAAKNAEDDGLDKKADQIRDEILPKIEAEEELGYQEWVDVTIALTDIEDTRAQWLRSKIAKRSLQPMERMGFSTGFPVGPYMAGTVPDSRE